MAPGEWVLAMRRTTISFAVLSALALLGPATPASGGSGLATLNITKVVEGDGPTGGYLIEYTCDVSSAESDPEGLAGDVLAFDAAAPGSPETQTVILDSFAECSVEEIDSNGADSVSYACDHEPGAIDASPADEAQTEGFDDGCQSDRDVNFSTRGAEGTITVTNTFVADVIDDDDEQVPDADADVVTATPTFTG